MQDIRNELAKDGLDAPTVRQLKRKLDPEGVRGLMDEVSDFEVVAFAEADARELRLGGRPIRERTAAGGP